MYRGTKRRCRPLLGVSARKNEIRLLLTSSVMRFSFLGRYALISTRRGLRLALQKESQHFTGSIGSTRICLRTVWAPP